MQAEQQPLPQLAANAAEPQLQIKPQGVFVLTGDRLGIAERVAVQLKQRGAASVVLSADILSDKAAWQEYLDRYCQSHGSIRGIVHLCPLSVANPPTSLAAWKTATQLHAKALFHLVQYASSSQQLRHVLCASGLGGYFGRFGDRASSLAASSMQGPVTGGAGLGFVKTLAAEQPQVRVKAVDFNLDLEPSAIARLVVAELLAPQGRIEVGYPQGSRVIFRTVAAPIESQKSRPLAANVAQPQISPQADWVVLVTGGARGITAEIASRLAPIGLTLVLLGRSPYPSGEEDPLTRTSEATEQLAAGEVGMLREAPLLRHRLIQIATEQGETPTPAQIERKIAKIVRDREIRRNVRRLCQLGATVDYRAVDVRDETALSAAIADIYQRYRRLDLVVHGAGAIADKLIVDKSYESFDAVFDTKADSTFLLGRYLQPETLKALLLFGSVAGRYGNRGQSDYAAANEVTNRLGWQLARHWPNVRVATINWGPWDTTGMASEEVKRQFRDRGVIPIPIEAGCDFFWQELTLGSPEDVEIIAGEGPWEAYETSLETWEAPADVLFETNGSEGTGTEQSRGASRNAPTGFVDRDRLQLQSNGSLLLEHRFSARSDPYLLDHRLDDQLVLPAAVALEWLAQLAQATWPDWVVTDVRDLRVLRGLTVPLEGERSVVLRVQASSHGSAESVDAIAQILDPERQSPFYQATVTLAAQLEPSPPIADLEKISGPGLDVTTAYDKFLFHGDRFRLIEEISCCHQCSSTSLATSGIDARVRPTSSEQWLNRPAAGWLFDPGLIDTAPQLAIVWMRLHRDTTVLPNRFGRVRRYQASLQPQPLHLALRVQQAEGTSLLYHAWFYDDCGRIHFAMEDVEGTGNAALNRLAARPVR